MWFYSYLTNLTRKMAQIWRAIKRKISVTCCFTTRYAGFGGERGINTFSKALRKSLIFKFCLFSSSLNICFAWRRYVAKNVFSNH